MSLPDPAVEPDEPEGLAEPQPEPEPEGRRYPSTIGGAGYLLALAVTGVGITVVAFGDWRGGVRWIAAALIGAALLRLVLPVRDAGMLAVRHRGVDCLLLGGVGGLLIFLAATIPNQPV